jgi:peroxiredoxin
LKTFDKTNAQIIAVDPHDSWSAKYLLKEAGASTDDLSFPMLMDPSLTVSSMYGVSFQMRIHTELSNRPATFVIDKAGVIQFAQRANQFNDRPSAKKILEVLNGLE